MDHIILYYDAYVIWMIIILNYVKFVRFSEIELHGL